MIGLLTPRIESQERRMVALAFACYFMLMGSYYILRPVRDTVATVFGVGSLQLLFTGTFIGTLVASPIYAALAARVRLSRLLPGVFWFWLVNVLLFLVLFRLEPGSRCVAAAYFIWFSVVNLFMISVFWTLMSDMLSTEQATRLFPLIAAGGSIGAIAGPLVTRFAVRAVGLGGTLLFAAAGFVVVIALVHLLMHEKVKLRAVSGGGQRTTLDHGLRGGSLDGFFQLMRSAYSRRQAAFMLLMTWVNTVAYFLQTDVVSRAFSAIEARAVAVADISLAVNICAAVILLFGMGGFVRRFGVKAGLLLNPIIMVVSFALLALSPVLLGIQAIQVIRQVSQYAIARPAREICFTVVPQEERYKSKNVIDTVVYRFGDLSAAWMQAGLRFLGLAVVGSAVAGLGASLVWGVAAWLLGRRFEQLHRQQPTA